MGADDKWDQRARTFGLLVKRKRTEKGWTLREFERRSGGRISNPYLSQLERGVRGVPTLKVIETICITLNVGIKLVIKEIFD